MKIILVDNKHDVTTAWSIKDDFDISEWSSKSIPQRNALVVTSLWSINEFDKREIDLIQRSLSFKDYTEYRTMINYLNKNHPSDENCPDDFSLRIEWKSNPQPSQ